MKRLMLLFLLLLPLIAHADGYTCKDIKMLRSELITLEAERIQGLTTSEWNRLFALREIFKRIKIDDCAKAKNTGTPLYFSGTAHENLPL